MRLLDQTVTIEQNTPLPADHLTPQKRGSGSLSIERPSPNRAVYTVD